jgi:hypothetical protein
MAYLGRRGASAALTSADIPDNSITADKIVDGAVGVADIGASAVGTSEMAASVIGVKPHIIPDVLYPAVAGKLLDSTTSHGGTYGVAQADGRSYYYTDIAGSKPIKDPRIGSHFGSQRHGFTSMQLLEQETATNGSDVYSVDGREWLRLKNGTGNDELVIWNDGSGTYFASSGSMSTDATFFEIVGYFNDANIHTMALADSGEFGIYLDGGTVQNNDFDTTVTTPLNGRYVRSGSLGNLTFNGGNPTLGIHTLKIAGRVSHYWRLFGIELIAQDTSNVNNIQIPSQNVVSYGKKFTVSGTPHYDPFNGFTNGTTLHSDVVDTATSLGLSTGTLHGATWAISGSNNIRPYNGGRVVKWVASDGTIKTSVNMMPPNAQNISTTAAAEITTPSATNTAYLPAFSDDAVDHSLAEVAKTFHWREFGNGAANGGTGATYADASMINAVDDIAYVMDDGLTSLSSTNMQATSNSLRTNASNVVGEVYFTFIGTGVTFPYYTDSGYDSDIIIDGVKIEDTGPSSTNRIITVQNLPYGTHIVKIIDNSTNTLPIVFNGSGDITFHQPKMPPIPEDAVVIADYMLMADYVKSTDGGIKISKGIRLVSATRDCFHDTSVTFNTLSINPTSYIPFGFTGINTLTNAADTACKLPSFGTHGEIRSYANRGDLFVDDVDVAGTGSGSTYTAIVTQDTASTLGLHTFESRSTTSTTHIIQAIGVATPIHTSSHYQTFETPFLHELVGGDRNMEQTNLVVTPDGKTWDEVTRDTSYIGSVVVSTTTDTQSTSGSQVQVFDEWRGIVNTWRNNFNKDFAIAYDRMICLVEGSYKIDNCTITKGAMVHCAVHVNGTVAIQPYGNPDSHDTPSSSGITLYLKRGDYIQNVGGWYNNTLHGFYQITRMD